nr:PQQ-binding-like beta-propeller repeat protein [Halovivax cerinus]
MYIVNGSHHGTLSTLDTVTGETHWEVDTRGNLATMPTVAGGIVYFGSQNGVLYAIDAMSGEKCWAVDASFDTGLGVTADPTVVGDTVVVGTLATIVLGVDTDEGGTRWTFSTEGRPSPATVVDGTAFFGTDEGTLYAIDVPNETGNSTGSRVLRGTLGHHDHTVHRRPYPDFTETCLNCETNLAHLEEPSYCPNCGWELSA